MSTQKPVHIGVVSTARIAREKVIPGFRTTPWLEVAAIASRNMDTAKTTAAALGIPVAHGSYRYCSPTRASRRFTSRRATTATST